MNLHEAFFCILRLGLGMENEFPYMLTREEWQELMDMGYRQSLFGVIMDGIGRLNPEQKPPRELLLRGMQLLMKIEMTNRHLNRRVRETVDYFEKEKLHVCLLKGQGLAALYPNPLHRMPGDIDIWLTDRPDDKPEWIIRYVKAKYPDSEVIFHHADFPLWDDVEVEMHIRPSYMFNPFKNRILDKLACGWKKTCGEAGIAEEGKVTVPSLEMNRVFVLLHIYRHLFSEGIGFRQLMDYMMVLKQGFTEEERTETVRQLKMLGLTNIAGAVMYVLKTVWKMPEKYMLVPPSERHGKQLLKEILVGGNFGTYDHRVDRKWHRNQVRIFMYHLYRNLRYLFTYPNEVLWFPYFRVMIYFWRFPWK